MEDSLFWHFSLFFKEKAWLALALALLALASWIVVMYGRRLLCLLKDSAGLWWLRSMNKQVGDSLRVINDMSGRSGLYKTILHQLCLRVDVANASLLAGYTIDAFTVKACIGAPPLSFVIDEFAQYFRWLEEEGDIITKQSLFERMSESACDSIQMRYLVQFNADMCVPLFVGGRLVGVVNLGARRGQIGYDSKTIELVRFLCRYSSALIYNLVLTECLGRYKLKLDEMQTLKRQMVSNISHELRTPLNAIIGLAELMAGGSDGEVTEGQRKHLDTISQSARRLLELLDDMLELSKVESDRLRLRVRKINLSRLVSNVADQIKFSPYTKLHVDLSNVPVVFGDESKVYLVFKHILGNAAKFTKSGKILVKAEKTGEMVRVCVSDTGIGVHPKHKGIIFDSFRQVDSTHSRSFGGMGLGLALSKRMIELHGGRIWFESEPGKGSNFYFTLPVKPICIPHGEIVH